jgi:hypothetical protein
LIDLPSPHDILPHHASNNTRADCCPQLGESLKSHIEDILDFACSKSNYGSKEDARNHKVADHRRGDIVSTRLIPQLSLTYTDVLDRQAREPPSPAFNTAATQNDPQPLHNARQAEMDES